MTFEEAKSEAQRLANEHGTDAVVLTESEDLVQDRSYWAELKHVWLEPYYNPNAGRVALVHPQ